MDRLISVATFIQPQDMAIARALLESQGIQCFAKDENTVSVHPFYSNALGGIKLQVPETDAERAAALLVEGGFIIPQRSSDPGTLGDVLFNSADRLRRSIPKLSPGQWRLVILMVVGSTVVLLVLSI